MSRTALNESPDLVSGSNFGGSTKAVGTTGAVSTITSSVYLPSLSSTVTLSEEGCTRLVIKVISYYLSVVTKKRNYDNFCQKSVSNA